MVAAKVTTSSAMTVDDIINTTRKALIDLAAA